MSRTPFASLHAGLLARKGEAEPAARPLALVPDLAPPNPADQTASATHDGDGEGRADCRRKEARRKVLAQHGTSHGTSAASRPAAHGALKTPPGRRIHMSVRLTPEDHTRLKIACAQLDCSNQALIMEALEAYLDALSQGQLHGCACMEQESG